MFLPLNQLFLLPFHFAKIADHVTPTWPKKYISAPNKPKQINTIIEFSISKSVQAQSFISFQQFSFLHHICPKSSISGPKEKT